jgi:hypothetical protein
MPMDGVVADRRGRLLEAALAGAGITLAAVGLCAVAASEALVLGSTYAPKAVAGFAGVAALIVATLPEHHPCFVYQSGDAGARARRAAAALIGEVCAATMAFAAALAAPRSRSISSMVGSRARPASRARSARASTWNRMPPGHGVRGARVASARRPCAASGLLRYARGGGRLVVAAAARSRRASGARPPPPFR